MPRDHDRYERLEVLRSGVANTTVGELLQRASCDLGGDAVIGESTLMLELAGTLAAVGRRVLCVSGEVR